MMKNTDKTIAKPVKHTSTYYKWGEIEEYIGKKYKRHLRDWAGKFDSSSSGRNKKTDWESIPYQDFWHWLLDHNEINNGTLTTFYPGPWLGDYENEPKWVHEILELLEKEFGSQFDVYICW